MWSWGVDPDGSDDELMQRDAGHGRVLIDGVELVGLVTEHRREPAERVHAEHQLE